MEEKKIATSVDILINVGAYEHIQITKYAEKKITYDNPEEMVQKEDLLTDELVKDILRTMRSIPDKLGKKTDAVARIEEKIGKKMPTWLEEGVEPNIANTAQKNANKAIEEASAKKEDAKEKSVETENFLEGKTEEPAPTKEEPKKEALDDDLFGDDEDLFK